MASLDEGYVSLIELSTENGGLVVRLCSRPEDGRSRFVCHEVYPARPRKDCSIPLVSLNISRSGPFLNFNRLDQPNQASELWARLKFLSYESTYMILFPLALALMGGRHQDESQKQQVKC